MANNNDVTITEQSHSEPINKMCWCGLHPETPRFSAERMPEDVQKLVEKAQARTGEWTDIANATTDIRLIAGLAAALEAAYSKESSDEPH